MTDDLLRQAAEVLQPLVGLGSGAVAAGAAETLGADLWRAAQRVLPRLRLRNQPDVPVAADELVAALRSALNEHDIKVRDLRQVVDLGLHPGGQNVFTGEANTVIQGGEWHVKGGMDFRTREK